MDRHRKPAQRAGTASRLNTHRTRWRENDFAPPRRLLNPSMLTIVFSKPYWPSIGGVESSSRILARVLTQAGCRVIVITATQLDGLAERDDGFAVCRDMSFRSLLRHTGSAKAVIINGGLSVPAALASWLRRKPFAVWHQMAGATGLMAETLSQKVRLSNGDNADEASLIACRSE